MYQGIQVEHMSYDFEWHKSHGEMTSNSARMSVGPLLDMFGAKSVLDVGCGDGRWLAACQELGVETIAGVDGPWTELDKLLIPSESVVIQDLSQSFDLGKRFDLAMSLEVAEHVPESSADIFVENMIRHADLVLFAAAIPYQGGYRHINEQWQSYWQKLYDARGYQSFDVLRAKLWHEDGVHYWYKQNMLVYVNRDRADLIETVEQYIAQHDIRELPTDLVHPEKYEAIASYDQIAFKPLLKKLPGQTLKKASAVIRGKI